MRRLAARSRGCDKAASRYSLNSAAAKTNNKTTDNPTLHNNNKNELRHHLPPRRNRRRHVLHPRQLQGRRAHRLDGGNGDMTWGGAVNSPWSIRWRRRRRSVRGWQTFLTVRMPMMICEFCFKNAVLRCLRLAALWFIQSWCHSNSN